MPLMAKDPSQSMVTLRVTSQDHDHYSPWVRGREQTEFFHGFLIRPGLFLTTAAELAHHQHITLTKIGMNRRVPATVQVMDEDANLALVKCEDPALLEGMVPLEIGPDRLEGLELEICRLEGDALLRQPVHFLEPSGIFSLHNAFRYACDLSVTTSGAGWAEGIFHDGMLMGISYNYNGKTKEMRIISPVGIRRFLEDVDDGRHDGMVYSNLYTKNLYHRPHLRSKLGLPQEGGGVFVAKVPRLSSEYGLVKVGDVLLTVDGYPLNSRGKVNWEPTGPIDFEAIIFRHQVGEVVEMGLFRDGKPMVVKVPLRAMPERPYLIPQYQYEGRPSYVVYGGMVFQVLTRKFSRLWNNKWPTSIHRNLVYRMDNAHIEAEEGRVDHVILNRVLPAKVNVGYQDLRQRVVESVNGKAILSIADLKGAFDAAQAGSYVEIVFEGGIRAVLSVDEVKATQASLFETYNIKEGHHLP